MGAAILFAFGILGDLFGIPHKVASALNLNPFDNVIAFFIVLFAMFISGLLIFLFNYNFSFKSQIEKKHLRFKLAFTTAIITIPWTFLLPTQWFYI